MTTTLQKQNHRSWRFRPMRKVMSTVARAAAFVPNHRADSQPLVYVVGLHSSGSSAMAGVLYHLGVHMGNNLGGYYGKKPNESCGYEDKALSDFCDKVIPGRALEMNCSRAEITEFMRKWVSHRRREALWMGTIAGCKYPKVGPMADVLRQVVGDKLLVIDINRPLNESISSLVRRDSHTDPKILAAHQTWLWNVKVKLLADMPRESVHTVEYATLLKRPEQVISNVVEFLKLAPSLKQVGKAITYVDPNRRHVFEADKTHSGTMKRAAA